MLTLPAPPKSKFLSLGINHKVGSDTWAAVRLDRRVFM